MSELSVLVDKLRTFAVSFVNGSDVQNLVHDAANALEKAERELAKLSSKVVADVKSVVKGLENDVEEVVAKVSGETVSNTEVSTSNTTSSNV